MDENEVPLDYFEERLSIPVIILFFAVNLPLFGAAIYHRFSIFYWISAFALFFLLANIYSVRLSVDAATLKFSYGVGIFSSNIDVFSIQAARIGQNDKLWAWVFSAFSPNVVILSVRDAAEVSVPTGNPNKLVDVLRMRGRISF